MNQYELPDEIYQQLVNAPDARRNETAKLYAHIDTAIKNFYPQKSVKSLARVFGVAPGTIKLRIDKLGL